jgi:phage terminase large subunit
MQRPPSRHGSQLSNGRTEARQLFGCHQSCRLKLPDDGRSISEREFVGAEAIYSTPPSASPAAWKRKPRSLYEGIEFIALRAVEDATAVRFPTNKWAHDPVGFARDVFGVELWSKQVELLESIRDNRNTTAKSGHKCGKTADIAIAATWFYCTHPDARVILTAVKAKQIDEAIWREITALYRKAKARGFDLGEIFIKASAGLRAPDGRQIIGLTAAQAEGNAGISGANILLLVDEASGVQDRTFEVLGSSLAGSGGVVRKVYISNPTKTFGEFYRSHTSNRHLYNCITISSEDTPNARGTGMIPGLAGPEWIAEKEIEYGGRDSAQYRVRVLGEFVSGDDGQILTSEALTNAQARWDESEAEGRLHIGIDPAGSGQGGDASGFAARRGQKVLKAYTRRALTPDGHLAELRGLISMFARPGDEPPVVVLDSDGEVGWHVRGALLGFATSQGEYTLVCWRAGHRVKEGGQYLYTRDLLYANAQKWIATGALPEDLELEAELHAASWQPSPLGDLHTATNKKELRKMLGRSPDKGDAVLLSLYTPQSITQESEELRIPTVVSHHDDQTPTGIDPYALDGVTS